MNLAHPLFTANASKLFLRALELELNFLMSESSGLCYVGVIMELTVNSGSIYVYRKNYN